MLMGLDLFLSTLLYYIFPLKTIRKYMTVYRYKLHVLCISLWMPCEGFICETLKGIMIEWENQGKYLYSSYLIMVKLALQRNMRHITLSWTNSWVDEMTTSCESMRISLKIPRSHVKIWVYSYSFTQCYKGKIQKEYNNLLIISSAPHFMRETISWEQNWFTEERTWHNVLTWHPHTSIMQWNTFGFTPHKDMMQNCIPTYLIFYLSTYMEAFMYTFFV